MTSSSNRHPTNAPPELPKKQIAAPGSACYTAGMEFDFNRFLGFTGNFGVVLLASGLLDDLLSVAGGTPIGRILMASGAALIYLSSFRQKDNE